MCINEETSWTTLVIGTIVNISILVKLYPSISKNSYNLKTFIIILLWQYALLMQIPDGLAWNRINNNEDTTDVGYLAAFLNLTQPIICFILMALLIHLTTKDYMILIPGCIILILYIINIIFNLHKFKFDVKPSENCNGLNYQWWEHINSIFYLLAIPVLLLSLNNLKLFTINIIIFFGSLLASILLTYGCNPGSLWCWSISLAGLVNYCLKI